MLVLEAGGSDRRFWLRLPVGYFRSIYDARVSRLFRAEPDAGIAGRQMDVPRGCVMGGSSAINGLIWAVVVAIAAALWFDDRTIGFIIAAAMIINLITAALAGALLPMIMQKLKILNENPERETK